MKRIILLLIINFAFGQTVDELRIMREKAFDDLAKSKNATHDVQRGNLHGVPISQEQKQAFLAIADSLDNEVVKLLTGVVEPKPEPIDSLKLWVDELVAGAEDYFWKSPRANSIQRVQLALAGDMSGVDYLIENYRTRIYSAQHEYVLNQLNKIKEL